MIIADLNYLESASEVISDLCGGRVSVDLLASASAQGPFAVTLTGTKTFSVDSPYFELAAVYGYAVAFTVNLPSIPSQPLLYSRQKLFST